MLPSRDVMEGALIGQYRVVRMLGEGGMGTVWLAEHTLLGKKAAIKVLLPEYTTNETIVQRFFNEARAVTTIADPGIVQVFDFGHANGSAFIVMECLDGEALDTRLRRIGRFAPHDTVRLMVQISASLGAAHAKGVIHRDLKPENIFIVGDPAVTGGERTKILDFGIAKLAGDENSKHKTRTGMDLGARAGSRGSGGGAVRNPEPGVASGERGGRPIARISRRPRRWRIDSRTRPLAWLTWRPTPGRGSRRRAVGCPDCHLRRQRWVRRTAR